MEINAYFLINRCSKLSDINAHQQVEINTSQKINGIRVYNKHNELRDHQ